MKQVDVAIGILEREGLVLICRRPVREGDAWGGLWEFPGGKCGEGERAADCVVREFREEVGVEICVGEDLGVIEHDYATVRVRLHPYLCRWVGGEAQGVEGQEVRWVRPAELGEYSFPEANAGLIRIFCKRDVDKG